MKTVYIADDGKQFKTKEECARHERNLKKKTLFEIHSPTNDYDCIFLKQDENGTLYIEQWGSDYREGGLCFNGTLKDFLKKCLLNHV